MGQYYKALVKSQSGEKVFCPHNALYMTKHGLDEMPEDVPYGTGKDPDSYLALIDGIKLMEHSYIPNRFVNGVLEEIEGKPSRVAWIGDYADEESDFTDLYTAQDHDNVWNDGLKESAFGKFPETHEDGYIVNHSKGQYIDLAKYVERNEQNGWCVHPLPFMVAIGNGRGGGDYRGYNESLVGTWAMDVIEYVHEEPKAYSEFLPLFDAGF